MKKINISFLLITTLILLFSCSKSNKEAEAYLANIHNLYQAGNYEEAKNRIDSIQILYPKAFEQIKEGMALLQDVRRAENSRQIAFCDSMTTILQPKIDSLKQYFIYERNKEYEDAGRYLHKTFSSSVLSSTGLRAAVNEDGSLYLETTYIGGNYHNTLRISIKDGSFAETLSVTDDGLNFRFNDLGKNYEVIRFSKQDENGVAKFIYAHSNQPLTATLKGKSTNSFALGKDTRNAIADSYQLSVLMLEADSLKSVKETTEVLNRYLDEKKQEKEINNP